MSAKSHNFNKKMIAEAEHWAAKSKDPSTQVGVVIVPKGTDLLIPGYNGFPRGVNDDEQNELGRWDRPTKYSFVEHAERNAIYNAAKLGISTNGAKMYFNYEPIPCTDCCRAVIQSGIVEVIGYPRPFPGKGKQWEESLAISRVMLEEAGVKITYVAGDPYTEVRDAAAGPVPCGCDNCRDGSPLPRVEGFFDAPRIPRGHR